MARLEVVAGRAIGMSILLDDELLIGRHADGAGRLAGDDEISRSHARISLDRAGFCAIEDLGSTNGTFVNGLRINGPQTLSAGDAIEVGSTTLVVRELPIAVTERLRGAAPRRHTSAPGGPPPSAPTTQETPAAKSRAGRVERASRPAERPPATPPAPCEPGAGPTPVSTLSLKLHVDFEARVATIAFEDGSPAVNLVFDGDAWRPASS